MGKKLTLEDIAQTMSEGFQGLGQHIDRRFDEVDRRFDEVDRRFEKVDRRFDEVDRRFDEVNGRLDTLEKDMSQVKFEVNEIHMKLPYFAYAMDVKDLRERVARLEKKLGN